MNEINYDNILLNSVENVSFQQMTNINIIMDVLHLFPILYLPYTVCMLHEEHVSFHTSHISRSPFLNHHMWPATATFKN